jgi:hypothetical protein
VKCRACQAEIADKAIVCYRCGTPTAELPSVPRKAPAPRRAPWWIAVVLVAIIGAAAYVVPMTPPDTPQRYGAWVLVVLATFVTVWLARRR